MNRSLVRSASLALSLTLLVSVSEAVATFPGANGKIAASSNADGDFEIVTVNPDGSGFTNLTNNTASDFQAAWSPDGTRIAFQSNRDGNFEIYVMNEDGSGQTRLTNNPANDASPAWSPNGTMIAFSSTRDGNPEIYVMNADGSTPTRLTTNPASDIIPRWSPDNSKIAFSSNRDGNFEAYSMGTDGSGQTNLTQNPANDFASSWYPNGSWLAFSSNRDGNNNIYVMRADGSNQTRVTDDPASDTDPAFSPGGDKIYFDSDREGMSSRSNSNPRASAASSAATFGIWRMNLMLPVWTGGGELEAFLDEASGGGESHQPVQGPPNLEVTKTANVRRAGPGDKIEWTITVRNMGGYLEDVHIFDRLDGSQHPLGLPFGGSSVCDDWKSVGVSPNSTCELGDLASGESRVIRVTSKVRRRVFSSLVRNDVTTYVGDSELLFTEASVPLTCSGAGQRTPLNGGRLRVRGLNAAGSGAVRGTSHADLICGTGKADTIDGRGGNDRIFGLGGDDVLIGGGGKDKLVGGPGDDQCSQTSRSALKPC